MIAIDAPKLGFIVTADQGHSFYVSASQVDKIGGKGSARKLRNYGKVRIYSAAVFDCDPAPNEYRISGLQLVSIILGTAMQFPERKRVLKFEDLFDRDHCFARDWFKHTGIFLIKQQPPLDGFDRAQYHAAMAQIEAVCNY